MNLQQLQLNLDLDELRRKAKSLLGKLDRYYMELGAVLWTVYEVPAPGTKRPIWDVWGYPSFIACAEEEMGIKAPSADRLRKIYKVLHINLAAMDHQTREELISMGYSKLREIHSYLTLENAKDWAAKGKDKTHKQFMEVVKAYRQSQRPSDHDEAPSAPQGQYGKGGEGVADESGVSFGSPSPQEPTSYPSQASSDPEQELSPSSLVSVSLNPDEAVVVESAIAMAGSFCKTNRKGEHLTMMAKAYLAMFPMEGESPADFLQQLEAKMGVKLVAIAPTGEVLYGQTHIEE